MTAVAAGGAAAGDGHAGCHPYLQSAVFPGCVQLLANVFSIKPQLPASWGNAAATRTNSGKFKDNSSRISFSAGPPGGGSMVAAQLLTAVCGRLQQPPLAAAVTQQEVAGADLEAASAGRIDVFIDGCVASQQGVAATAAREKLPAHADVKDVAGKEVALVHTTTPTPAAPASPAAASPAGGPAMQLLYCQPGCLIAGREQQQQQQLELTVAGLSSTSSRQHCRLLLMQDGAVAVEVPDVVMQQTTRGTWSLRCGRACGWLE
jgi:hypothetical protein